MKLSRFVFATVILAALLAGCGDNKPAETGQATPAGAPPVSAEQQSAAQSAQQQDANARAKTQGANR